MTGAASTTSSRSFVLVHGAWHGGWCWRRVADVLSASGHRVFAPSLTGLGDRAHLFSAAVSPQTHVDDIVSVIDSEELRDPVVVGHSYAGLVISGVADILRNRASHYVYLDAAVPDDMSTGQSVGWSDLGTPAVREARLKLIREQGNGVALPPPSPDTFGLSEPADVAWVQRRLRPMPLQTFIGRITFKHSGSAGLRRTYIAATRPPYAALADTHARIKADKTWSFTTIEAGHDAMVTAPVKLAALLMQV